MSLSATVPSRNGSQCEKREIWLSTLFGSGEVILMIQSPRAIAKLNIAAITVWFVRQETKSPIEAKVAPRKLIPIKHDINRPKSRFAPGKTERHIRNAKINTISKNATVAKNFPSIISVIEIGAEIRKMMV